MDTSILDYKELTYSKEDLITLKGGSVVPKRSIISSP